MKFTLFTYTSFLISIFLLLSAIFSTTKANDLTGRNHIASILNFSLLFMLIYLVCSIFIMLITITTSVRFLKRAVVSQATISEASNNNNPYSF